MKAGCVIGWGLSAVLAIGLGAMSYVFLVRGEVETAEDGRTAILLAPGERDLVLAEMRGLLEAVQAIIAAAAEDDMETVAAAARAVGMAEAGTVPPGLIRKLPLDFKQKGMATHRSFDALADLALAAGDGREVLRELGGMMESCTGCHAGYRLGVDDGER